MDFLLIFLFCRPLEWLQREDWVEAIRGSDSKDIGLGRFPSLSLGAVCGN